MSAITDMQRDLEDFNHLFYPKIIRCFVCVNTGIKYHHLSDGRVMSDADYQKYYGEKHDAAS